MASGCFVDIGGIVDHHCFQTDATRGVGFTYPSEAPEFTHDLMGFVLLNL
jgi:hypothetical protein